VSTDSSSLNGVTKMGITPLNFMSMISY
jgi:hypothetical protein